MNMKKAKYIAPYTENVSEKTGIVLTSTPGTDSLPPDTRGSAKSLSPTDSDTEEEDITGDNQSNIWE